MLLLLFNIFISRLFSCKVPVNVLQVEMIGLSNAMNRSWIWNVSSLFWCVSFPRTPFPHRYSDGQDSLLRGGLIINETWPRKRSFLFGYCKEYLPQCLGRTLNDVRESEAIHLALCVSSCPNNGWRPKRLVSFYSIKEVNKQLN